MTVVSGSDARDDRKTEAGTFTDPVPVCAVVETVEDPIPLGLGDAGASVAYPHQCSLRVLRGGGGRAGHRRSVSGLAGGGGTDRGADGNDVAGAGVSNGVLGQLHYGLGKPLAVRENLPVGERV